MNKIRALHHGQIIDAYLASEVEATVAELERENAKYEAALQRIAQWSEAYPLDVFPEPDFAKVNEVLKAAGLSLDLVSASNMRHVVTGVGKIAKSVL